MTSIRKNLERIYERMAAAALHVGRDPADVQLVAVSKRVAPERIQEAVDAGQLLFGESYLQEAIDKLPGFSHEVAWHFIGHLQSNKAKAVVENFGCVETVDRLKLARALQKYAAKQGRVLQVFVQVNIGREPQKSGVSPEDASGFLRALQEFPDLSVRGLMAMPPFFEDPEMARPYFREARLLAEKLAGQGLLPDDRPLELSMGMSGDFEVAIEEGATLVRVGTALFGARG